MKRTCFNLQSISCAFFLFFLLIGFRAKTVIIKVFQKELQQQIANDSPVLQPDRIIDKFSTSFGTAVATYNNTQTIFSTKNPLFVLSLPNHAPLALARYFRCAGIDPVKVGRHWTRYDPFAVSRQPIGDCFLHNLKRKTRLKPITNGCGKFQVWMDLQHLEGPFTIFQNTNRTGKCFDPVLYPGALERLFIASSQATILNIVQDPQEWYKTLPKDYPWHWSDWCNPTHDNAFPNQDTEENYVQFYNMYQDKLRAFVRGHPSWNYIEVDLRDDPESTDTTLANTLGIPKNCWTRSYSAQIPELPDAETTVTTTTTSHSLLPRTISFPILVTSLPKSGTTTIFKYFRCGLGRWTAAHQQVLNLTTGDVTTIGECMLDNLSKDKALLHRCGNARVFSDVGIFVRKQELCYYPTLHGGLEEFAKAYPYGTILHLHRNVTSWVKSANRWGSLLGRWAQSSSLCQDVFPPPGSSEATWEDWYRDHNQKIKDFASKHPTLTYLDIPLVDASARTYLQEAFGFHPDCWGHANVNEKKAGDVPLVKVERPPPFSE